LELELKKKDKIKMGKQRAIKLNLNNTFREKKFGCKRNIVKDGKNETEFEPICVFAEEGIPRWKFWKRGRRLIFFVDGALRALRFGKTTEEMNPFDTQEDIRKLIVKEMKKSLAKHKPMSWMQFIIILLPVAGCLILLLKIATYLGAL